MLERKFLGLTVRRWLEYLAATVIGNLVYFYSLEPHLPTYLQHNATRGLDWGSLIDFLVCVAVFGLIRLGSSDRQPSHPICGHGRAVLEL